MSETKTDPMFPDDGRMKPMMIIPPETMSDVDIELLRANGICVVVAKDPSSMKFVDPIPSMAGRSKMEQAAIELSRRLLDRSQWNAYSGGGTLERSAITRLFIDLLTKGTSLDPDPIEEQQQRAFNEAKLQESRRLGQQEARDEAKERKAQREAAKQKKTTTEGSK